MNPFKAELARRHLMDFVQTVKPNYQAKWFHEVVCNRLERWAKGEVKRLMVCLPPQHGKSELSSRTLPSWIIGREPATRIALVSYSQDFVSGFNRDIQRIISSEHYAEIFPGVRLPESSEIDVCNSSRIEIPKHRGAIITVGVGGALTGEPVDKMIIDDVYKNAEDAWSPVYQAKVQDWYSSVAETRLHNNSQVLVVITRWHENDLPGWLMENEEFEVLVFPAIKRRDGGEYDIRGMGDPLWAEKHSLDKLLNTEKRDRIVFESLYQQDPKPAEGMVYIEWNQSKWSFIRESIIHKGGVTGYWENGVERKLESWYRCWCGLDTGRHTGWVLVAVDDANRFIVIDEVYDLDGRVRDIADKITPKMRGRNVIGKVIDSASQVKREYESHGYSSVDSDKDVLGAIQTTRDMMRAGRLIILSHNKCLIDEMDSRRWDSKRKEKPQPVKEHDHVINALEYILLTFLRGRYYQNVVSEDGAAKKEQERSLAYHVQHSTGTRWENLG